MTEILVGILTYPALVIMFIAAVVAGLAVIRWQQSRGA
jgi:hypothetical protein